LLSFTNLKRDITTFIPSVKALQMQWRDLNNKMTGSVPVMTSLKNVFTVLKSTTIAQTIATGALRVATMLLNAVVGMGIGLLVSGVISGVMKLINHTSELKKNVEELTSSVQNNIQSNNNSIRTLSSLADRYDILTQKTSLTNEEQQELIGIQNQIAEISPEVVQGYDGQGNAIINLTGGVKGLIEQLKEKNKLEQTKLIDGADKSIENYNNQVDKSKKKLDEYTTVQKNLMKQIDETKAQMEQAKSSGDNDNYQYYNAQLKDMEDNLDKTNLKIKEQNAELQTSKSSIEPLRSAFLSVADGYDNLSQKQKNLADAMAKTLDPSNFSLKSFNQIISAINNKETTDALTKLEKLNMDKSKKSVEGFNKELLEIYTTLSGKTGKSVSELAGLFNIQPIDEATQAMFNFDEIQKKAINSAVEVSKQMKEVNTVLDEHAQSGEWNNEVLLKLAQDYPPILNAMGDDKALTQELIKYKENLSKSALDVAKTQMDAIAQQFSAYGMDVEAFTNAENAKTQIAKASINSRLGMYRQEMNAINSQYSSLESKWRNGTITPAEQTMFDNLQRGGMYVGTKYAQEVSATMISAQNYFNLKSLQSQVRSVLNGVGSSASNGKSSGGGSGSSTVYESKLDGADKYTAKIEDLNNSLQKQENIITNLSDKIKLYNDLGDESSLRNSIKLENDLYAEQGNKLSMLKYSLSTLKSTQSQISQEFKSRWGLDVSNFNKSDFTNAFERIYPTMTTKNKAYQAQYEAGKKMFNQLTDDWFKFSDEIQKTDQDIIQTQNDMITTIKDKFTIIFNLQESHLSKFKDSIDELNGSFESLNSNLGENYENAINIQNTIINQTQLYRDKIEGSIRELVQQQSTLQDGSAEWTIVNDKIHEYRGTLVDVNSQLNDAKNKLNEIKQEEVDLAEGMQDKIVEALRKRYETAQQAEIDTIEARKQTDIAIKNAELEQLQKELKALQDETEEKQNQLDKEKEELELWKKDNSVYAQSKIKELEDDIKKREKELAIDAKQKEIDDKQKEIDVVNDNAKKEEDIVQDKYKKLLEEQNLYKEATTILTTQTQDQILDLLLSYDEKYKGLGETLGKAFSDALISEIKKAKDAMDALSGVANSKSKKMVYGNKTDIENARAIFGDDGYEYIDTTNIDPSSLNLTANDIVVGGAGAYGGVGDANLNGATRLSGSNREATINAIRQYNNNKSAKRFVFGNNVDIANAMSVLGNDKFTYIDTDNIDPHLIKFIPSDIIVGGTGAIGGVPSDVNLNGAKRIAGANRDETLSLLRQQLASLDTGGYTGDWQNSVGKLAILHSKERVLNPIQTKAFEHLIYNILPKFYNQTAMGKLNTMSNVIFNEPIVKNDIKIVNNTPFDVDNNMDNLNKAIKQELKQSGFKINLIR
jgi:archaellum component FlaC